MNVLQKACYEGNADKIRTFLEAGANVNEIDSGGVALLTYAAYNGMSESIQVLCDAGAAVNSVDHAGRSAIWTCAQNGHGDAARLLHTYGADVNFQDKWGRSPLWRAAYSGHSAMIRLLFELGADLSARHDRGATPIYVGAEFGNVEVIRTLCDLGADVNSPDINGSSPLLVACLGGHIDAVILLLRRGADVNQRNSLGRTSLHEASFRGDVKVMHVLLQHGARQMSDFANIYPLGYAAYNGHVEAIRLLNKFGAEMNTRDTEGRSALWTASQRCQVGAVQVLIELGADVRLTDNQGRSPAWRATFSGNLSILRLLVSNGADIAPSQLAGELTPIDVAIDGQHIDCAIYSMCYDQQPSINFRDVFWSPLYAVVSSLKQMFKCGLSSYDNNDLNMQILLSNAVFDFLVEIQQSSLLYCASKRLPSDPTAPTDTATAAARQEQQMFAPIHPKLLEFVQVFANADLFVCDLRPVLRHFDKLIQLTLKICSNHLPSSLQSESVVTIRHFCLGAQCAQVKCVAPSPTWKDDCECAHEINCIDGNALCARMVLDLLTNRQRVQDVLHLRLTSRSNYFERRFTAFGSSRVLEPDLIESYLGGTVSGALSSSTLKMVLDCFYEM